MDKKEVRAVIKLFFLKGKTATQIKAKLNAVLGESAPSLKTVHTWVAEFKRGRTSCEDEPRSGRPKEVTTDEMIAKIHKIVMSDRRLKVREIAEIVSISTERVNNILHEHLGMKKLCARWVPRLLTLDQKRVRMDVSSDNLERFKRNPTEFLRRFITVDETWVHHHTPESKEQSKQWTERGELAPKKAKAPICWKGDGECILGCSGDNIHLLSLKRTNNQRQILRQFTAAFERRNQEKPSASRQEKSALSSGQCSCSHSNSCNGKNSRIEVRIASASTLFTRFGSLRLFSVPKPKETARRKYIFW